MCFGTNSFLDFLCSLYYLRKNTVIVKLLDWEPSLLNSRLLGGGAQVRNCCSVIQRFPQCGVVYLHNIVSMNNDQHWGDLRHWKIVQRRQISDLIRVNSRYSPEVVLLSEILSWVLEETCALLWAWWRPLPYFCKNEFAVPLKTSVFRALSITESWILTCKFPKQRISWACDGELTDLKLIN